MNRHRAGILGLIALTSGALLAGCSDKQAGRPTTAPTSSEQEPSSATQSGGSAPKVGDPIDPSRFLADPCGALSASAQSQLGLTGGTSRQAATGPSCSWNNPADQFSKVSITAAPDNKNGLGYVYGNKSSFGYFEAAEIAGHPAVYASPDDERGDGSCSLWVGLSDTSVVDVLTYFSSGSELASRPCPEAAKTAEAAIRTLKG